MKHALVVVALVAPAAFAQEGRREEGLALRRPQTVVDFPDDDVVEGRLSQPEVQAIVVAPKSPRESLLRVRENFNDKVMNSLGEL